jgi:hypothetical protein
MAGKSPAELIRELHLELTKLIGQLDAVKDEVRKAELIANRERLTKLEAVLEMVNVHTLMIQLGVIQEQLAELKRWREETERKRWQLNMVFFGCLSSLFVQLLVLFLKK